jgi:hypothetical protein
MALLMLFAWLTTALTATRDTLSSACHVAVTPINAVAEHMSPSGPIDEEQVAAWILKWQKRLKLEDWAIKGKIVEVRDLPAGSVAEIHWVIPKRTAIIKVVSAKYYRLEDLEVIRETELSVVHELVHLSMARMALGREGTEEEEAVVSKVSAALLELDAPLTTQSRSSAAPPSTSASRARKAKRDATHRSPQAFFPDVSPHK